MVALLRALHQPSHLSHYIRHRALPFEAFKRKQKDWTGEGKENTSPGSCSVRRQPMCPGSSLSARPALLESTAWSECICQFFALLSCGSVLTGVSRAGTAGVASSALAGEKEQEEGVEVLPSSLSCPSWQGTEAAGEEGWAGRASLKVLKDVPQACDLQEAPCSA